MSDELNAGLHHRDRVWAATLDVSSEVDEFTAFDIVGRLLIDPPSVTDRTDRDPSVADVRDVLMSMSDLGLIRYRRQDDRLKFGKEVPSDVEQ